MKKDIKKLPDSKRVLCSCCGKEFEQTDYSALCDAIMQKKPVCSYECNLTLGQVKKN